MDCGGLVVVPGREAGSGERGAWSGRGRGMGWSSEARWGVF